MFRNYILPLFQSLSISFVEQFLKDYVQTVSFVMLNST